jgi:hypothetical protein
MVVVPLVIMPFSHSAILPVCHSAIQEETRLAMVSVPESDFLSEKRKHKVTHLFNRNFGDFCENFLLGQLQ